MCMEGGGSVRMSGLTCGCVCTCGVHVQLIKQTFLCNIVGFSITTLITIYCVVLLAIVYLASYMYCLVS